MTQNKVERDSLLAMHYWKYKNILFTKCHNKAAVQRFGLQLHRRGHAVEKLQSDGTFIYNVLRATMDDLWRLAKRMWGMNQHLCSHFFPF